MRKINSTFKTKFISEEGSKLVNKDYFAFVELDQLACYVIVDGIDEDKEKQSGEMVAQSILRSFTERPTFRKRVLKEYIKRAHYTLQAESRDWRLKAAVTVVVTDYTKVRYIHVGNTRFYLIRNGRILQKSEDQSLSQLLVNREVLAQDKIAKHEERQNLYNYLGQEDFIKPYISKKIKLQNGDIWLLLTRGIWEHCDEGEMIDATDEAKTPEEVVDGIEELILAKQPSEIDNYTVAVTFIDKVYENPKKKVTLKTILKIAIPIMLIAIVLGTTLYIQHRNKQKKIQQMNDAIQSAQEYIASDNYPKANEAYDEALKLAKSLNKKEEKEMLSSYKQLLDQIQVADDYLKDGSYYDAQEAYLLADDLSDEADLIGKKYIEEKLKKVQNYIDVLDLLQEGDKQLDYGEVDAARNAYQAAKTLANENYFQEGKQEAIEKIDKIDSQKAEDKKAAKEEKAKEEEKQKEEEEQSKKEAEEAKAKEEEEAEKAKEEQKAKEEENAKILEAKLSALQIEKQGNTSYDLGSYEDAKMYYLIAKETYEESGLTERAEALDEKILLAEKKATELNKKIAKANSYMEDADEKVIGMFYDEADMLYLIAKGIYQDAGLEDKVKEVDEKRAKLEEIVAALNS